jgi:spore germination protein GerM
MQDGPDPSRRGRFGLILFFSALVVVVSGVTAFLTARLNTPQSSVPQPTSTALPQPTESAATATPQPTPTKTTAETTPQPTSQPTTGIKPTQPPIASTAGEIAQVYWLKSTGTQSELVPTTLSLDTQNKTAKSEAAKLESAFERLLSGPSDPATTTTIPTGTKLRSLALMSDGIHVDLSKEFTMGGGSASVMARLGQVIFTATSLEPDANVWISVEGKRLDVLGGEGLVVDQPLTRRSFEKDYR